MNIQATKIEIAQLVLNETSEVVLKKIKAILTRENSDWWDEISDEERAQIQEGINQADRGELISHQEVREKLKARFDL